MTSEIVAEAKPKLTIVNTSSSHQGKESGEKIEKVVQKRSKSKSASPPSSKTSVSLSLSLCQPKERPPDREKSLEAWKITSSPFKCANPPPPPQLPIRPFADPKKSPVICRSRPSIPSNAHGQICATALETPKYLISYTKGKCMNSMSHMLSAC